MKEILKPYYNLDEVFESEKFKVINIGELNITSGQIICCDPLVSLVNGEGEKSTFWKISCNFSSIKR